MLVNSDSIALFPFRQSDFLQQYQDKISVSDQEGICAGIVLLLMRVFHKNPAFLFDQATLRNFLSSPQFFWDAFHMHQAFYSQSKGDVYDALSSLFSNAAPQIRRFQNMEEFFYQYTESLSVLELSLNFSLDSGHRLTGLHAVGVGSVGNSCFFIDPNYGLFVSYQGSQHLFNWFLQEAQKNESIFSSFVRPCPKKIFHNGQLVKCTEEVLGFTSCAVNGFSPKMSSRL